MGCFIIIAEQKTGKVLHQDGSRYQEGDIDYRVPFESIDEAVTFAEIYRENHRDRECMVVADDGKFIRVFR